MNHRFQTEGKNKGGPYRAAGAGVPSATERRHTTPRVDPWQPSPEGRMRVYAGDIAASARPMTLDALLGSCVAVCLYDPYLRAGGMNHILLPGGGSDTQCARFGVHAMELLINEMMKQGADRRRFTAKAFGGGRVLAGLASVTIGEDNATFVRKFLAAEKIPLVAERLGGDHAVHVRFTTDTGKAVVRTVDGSRLTRIVHSETSYRRSHPAQENFGGEVTLF